MGKRLAVFMNSFLLLQVFWVKNAKIGFFKNNSFKSSYFFIKLTILSVRLEKHQTIEILLIVDFLRIFKILHFSKNFEIFEIHQYFLVKLLNALNFI